MGKVRSAPSYIHEIDILKRRHIAHQAKEARKVRKIVAFYGYGSDRGQRTEAITSPPGEPQLAPEAAVEVDGLDCGERCTDIVPPRRQQPNVIDIFFLL